MTRRLVRTLPSGQYRVSDLDGAHEYDTPGDEIPEPVRRAADMAGVTVEWSEDQ